MCIEIIWDGYRDVRISVGTPVGGLLKITYILLRFSDYILLRVSELGSPTNHIGLRAATRHGARDPLVRSQVDGFSTR